jgi:hypothetical protein
MTMSDNDVFPLADGTHLLVRFARVGWWPAICVGHGTKRSSGARTYTVRTVESTYTRRSTGEVFATSRRNHSVAAEAVRVVAGWDDDAQWCPPDLWTACRTYNRQRRAAFDATRDARRTWFAAVQRRRANVAPVVSVLHVEEQQQQAPTGVDPVPIPPPSSLPPPDVVTPPAAAAAAAAADDDADAKIDVEAHSDADDDAETDVEDHGSETESDDDDYEVVHEKQRRRFAWLVRTAEQLRRADELLSARWSPY